MNNNIILSTEDGKEIKIDFANKVYKYSVSSMSINASQFISDLASSEILEEVSIDETNIIEYNIHNEPTQEFVELWKFIVSIPKAYNKALFDMLELE